MDIVISGLSGRFPQCDNIDEFAEKLFAGVDLVTRNDRRWRPGYMGLPSRGGYLNDISKFDADFFNISAKQATCMDPQYRMLLEVATEAIMDAGINPTELRGSRTGVFAGITFSDAETYWSHKRNFEHGYALLGSTRSVAANRISYALDLRGPSMTIDSACSSSLMAIHQAANAIRLGECDAAIVAASTVILNPGVTSYFVSLGGMAPDGKCKVFDAAADGYVRAEAVVAVLLQRVMDARRNYVTIVKSMVNTDGYKEQGATYPNYEVQAELFENCYREAQIDPAELFYLEAHGTGTKVGDQAEVQSVSKVFCPEHRQQPLLIGSLKSNMGHSEAASGLCGIVKIILAMARGFLPANLHFNQLNSLLTAICDGKIKVVDKATPLPPSALVAINAFGITGSNAHVILRCNKKEKLLVSFPNLFMKRIVFGSGRTIDAVNHLFNKLHQNQNDEEYLALSDKIFSNNIPGHHYRGYAIFENEMCINNIKGFDLKKREVWYVFSGMGSQWSGMCRDLMSLPIFKESLTKTATVLKEYDLDLLDMICNSTDKTFDDIVKNFVCITATQIGLIDVLKTLKIKPDGLIGHSMGEAVCGYADGSLDLRQTILISYFRGRSVMETELPEGLMAAVGLSWKEIEKRCPPDIYPACDNGSNHVTISGPNNSMINFVESLKNEGIFVKLVNTAHYAFHCPYITPVASRFDQYLKQIIPDPKTRSSIWISTSMNAKNKISHVVKNNSAEYHVNNLVSPVLFNDAIKTIPDHAIVIEIAPHSLLQPILKRSLPNTCMHVGLQKRNAIDNLNHLLTSIGDLYLAGLQPKISNLYYDKIDFPVSRSTPILSSAIKWDHSTTWLVPNYMEKILLNQDEYEFDLSRNSDSYLAGHKLDGRILFPGSGYLTLAWKTFSNTNHMDYNKFPVVFKNIHFVRPTIMPKSGTVKFLVSVFNSGHFEISEGDDIVANGHIHRVTEETCHNDNKSSPNNNYSNRKKYRIHLTSREIYKELRLRGYEHSGEFASIQTFDLDKGFGKVQWNKNWIIHLDNILQFTIFNHRRAFYIPNKINRIVIDPVAHIKSISPSGCIEVHNRSNIKLLKTDGIEINNVQVVLTERRLNVQSPILEGYSFMRYSQDENNSKMKLASMFLQIVIENLSQTKLSTADSGSDPEGTISIMNYILDAAKSYPACTIDAVPLIKARPQNHHLILIRQCEIITENTNEETETLKKSIESLTTGGFLLIEDDMEYEFSDGFKSFGITVVAQGRSGSKRYSLWKREIEFKDRIIIEITEGSFEWLRDLKTILKEAEKNVQLILVSQSGDNTGIIGLVNCLRKEYTGKHICYVDIHDHNLPLFSLTDEVYETQINKQLVANVFKNGHWGSYRYLPLDQAEMKHVSLQNSYIDMSVKGDLNSLQWMERPVFDTGPLEIGGENISVYFSGLNYIDLLYATGKLRILGATLGKTSAEQIRASCKFGYDFAGRNSEGYRKMGFNFGKSLATITTALPNLTFDVPSHWSLKEASTVPTAFLTAYYALFIRGQLIPGESILIHSGAGDVEIAVITVALNIGCKVYVTVSTKAEHDFLITKFILRESNIFYLRDRSFQWKIQTATNGRGVDVIFNSPSGQLCQECIDCLAEGGRFIKIRNHDSIDDTSINRLQFLRNITFCAVDIYDFIALNCGTLQKLRKLFIEGLNNCIIQPIPATIFDHDQLKRAFHCLTPGKHFGKIVIKIREEENQSIIRPYVTTVTGLRRTYFDPLFSYIIIGGLGGFGLELVDWMIQRGARNVIIVSRSGIQTAYATLRIQEWNNIDARVRVLTRNVHTIQIAEKLINYVTKEIAPVAGIFNPALVLKDGLIESLNEEDFINVMLPKYLITNALDRASRKLCPHLKYFVTFSTLCSGRGNAGQTNYGLASSSMEKICERRYDEGLHGLCIQWGPIGDVGYIIDKVPDKNILFHGNKPQSIVSCLETLDFFLQQSLPIVSTVVLDQNSSMDVSGEKVSLVQSIARIIGIQEISKVHPSYTLRELGMDSMMASEIKSTLERKFNVLLTDPEIRNLRFRSLIELDNKNQIHE